MKFSVIVPVFNEEKTLAVILEKLFAVPEIDEIVVVDDGSTDRTAEIAKTYPSRIRFVRHEINRGKGAAIRTGLREVTGDVVSIQDGDLEYDPNDFRAMLDEFHKGADVVYGSRIKGGGKFSYRRFYFGGRFLSFLSNLLYGLQISDEPTCYKMMRTGILRRMNLQCEKFEFCPEVTAKAARMGHEIREVPISYRPRSLEEGKKIRWWDGVQAIWTLLRYRFWTSVREPDSSL